MSGRFKAIPFAVRCNCGPLPDGAVGQPSLGEKCHLSMFRHKRLPMTGRNDRICWICVAIAVALVLL
jgi:hypothetical protein